MTDILPILYGFGELVFAIVLLSILRVNFRARKWMDSTMVAGERGHANQNYAPARVIPSQHREAGSTPAESTNFHVMQSDPDYAHRIANRREAREWAQGNYEA